MTQKRNQVGQEPGESGSQLQIFQNQHGDQSRPDLRLHGVGTGSEEGLDLQVLFDCFEKQLDLPAVLVDRRDCCCRKLQVVGKKDHRFLLIFKPDLHEPKEVLVALLVCYANIICA